MRTWSFAPHLRFLRARAIGPNPPFFFFFFFFAKMVAFTILNGQLAPGTFRPAVNSRPGFRKWLLPAKWAFRPANGSSILPRLPPQG